MRSSRLLPAAALIMPFLLRPEVPPAPVSARYQGAATCAACHPAQSKFQARTGMGQSLEPVATCQILRDHPLLEFNEAGYATRIVREGDRSVLTVSKGGEQFSVPLLWAFGQGHAGQTYLFEWRGSLYETRLSYYRATNALDLTIGAQNTRPSKLEDYAGRRIGETETRACFGCHSTGGVRQDGMHWDLLTPGVTCEACHGPAAGHVEAMRQRKPPEARITRLSQFSTEEMSDFCGACHRTWAEVAVDGPRNVINVRFQPYRLTSSRCYDAADARIRCVACHDPHGPVNANAASYDSKCQACHTAAKACPVAKANCVGCHMPKVDLPGAHQQFTDHRIRIVRAGAPYPE